MFERIDEIADRFEARLSLFEKRIRRALRLRALIVFVPVAVLAISVNLFTYLTQKIVSFKKIFRIVLIEENIFSKKWTRIY
ncbi:hypothetical protein [Francisella salimarina]|uniref:hypothetical protein n=1 Tax=Francisella salimarina TaxID=2599927 RepID=UPI003D81366D